MPDIFYATVMVVWSLNGQAAIIERSEPMADKKVCEQLAKEMIAKHKDYYGQLPVKLVPKCEKWEPSLLDS